MNFYFCEVLVIRNTEHFRIEKPSIVTIGTFDGVHLGHQKILNKLKDLGKRLNLNTVVLTFDPHPRKVLFPDQKDLKLITLTEEKLELLDKFGIDIGVVYPFSKTFANLEPVNYIQDILVKQLKVKQLIIGYDHRFGKNREGDISVLKKFAPQFNYEVEEISAHDIDSIAISSSKIRNSLSEGNVESANKFLGHSFSLQGIVVKGKQLGRTIGYPTANIQLESEEKLSPAIGVYFVEVYHNNSKYHGMLNVGKNPTTDKDEIMKIEVNIFNFNNDIYGQNIKVCFLKRLRDEIKFSGLEELKLQLAKDKHDCEQLIEKLK